MKIRYKSWNKWNNTVKLEYWYNNFYLSKIVLVNEKRKQNKRVTFIQFKKLTLNNVLHLDLSFLTIVV